jgi:hypothetical protein
MSETTTNKLFMWVVAAKAVATVAIWGFGSYYGNKNEEKRLDTLKEKMHGTTAMPYGFMCLGTYLVWR